MRFESVTAHAFGALVERTLELAPGLTVVFAANEGGKSTWHDAIGVALCGMRRAPGVTKEDREFARRRRPWSGTAWKVSAKLQLEDGRKIELRHDLADLVDCRATDLALGRDVSAEVMNESTPDGARWLGLDRRTFPLTACVRQAELLGLLGASREDRDHLQQFVQRAADNAGRDQTAAAALERIREFASEQVGLDRAGAVRPLRRARQALENAESALEVARLAHRELLALCVRAEAASAHAEIARTALAALRAALARRDAEEAEARLTRARTLSQRFREGPPPTLPADDALSAEVAAALAAFDARPKVAVLDGPTAADLEARLAALPAPPAGDLEPHTDVEQASRAEEHARRRVELFEEQRPPEPLEPKLAAEPDQLEELADELSLIEPGLDAALVHRVATYRREIEALERKQFPWAMFAGGAIALVGAGVAYFAVESIGAVVAAGGLVLAFMGIGSVRARQKLAAHTRALLAEAEPGDRTQREAVALVRGRRQAASKRAAHLGAPTEPEALRELAQTARGAKHANERHAVWRTKRHELAWEHTETEGSLARALTARGLHVRPGASREAYEEYVRACKSRAELAARAGQRADLERELATRRSAEQARAEAERGVEAAHARVAAAAAKVGVGDAGAEQRVAGLRAWQERRKAELAALEVARNEHAELGALLGGCSLQDFEANVARIAEIAARLRVAAGGAELPAIESDADAQGARAEAALREAARKSDELRGQVERDSGRVPSVPEAEEAHAAAQAEVERVEALARTLERTREFLQSAADRVHRDLAPVLSEALGRWLPRITPDYREAIVDPATLEIRVRMPDGNLRPATSLSHGTAEQIYLLLRVALASRLTKPGEVCPILLDDVTVQSDEVRTVRILELLRELARERQVVLFSQEATVLGWAERSLDPARDRLVKLPV